MALINARMDAQAANVAPVVACTVADPLVTQRRHDAHREPSRHGQPVDLLPPLPHTPLHVYALPTHGPLFSEAPPHHVPTSRGHTHPHGPPIAVRGHSPLPGGPPPPFHGRHSPPAERGAHTRRGGRRPTIDPVVIGRAAHEATGFDKDALNRSMKMSVPTMGPTTDFKQWKRNFLNFLL